MRAASPKADGRRCRPSTAWPRRSRSARGALGPKPANPGPEWFDAIAANLVPAIEALPDVRYDAIVIDEGQDFEADWLLALQLLLRNPDDSILWVFHDPGQALYREDVVAGLGLERFELFEDYRSPLPVAELAAAFYRGPGEPQPMADGGREPRIRRGRARAPDRRGRAPRAPPRPGRRGRAAMERRRAFGRVGRQERRLERAAVRDRRALERGDR